MLEITSDLSHLYLSEKPHYPKFFDGALWQEGFDGHVVTLRARSQDDLDWKEALEKAELLKEKGSFILWDIDLGLSHDKIFTSDLALYSAQTRALEIFAQTVLPIFSSCTYGVILFRGNECFEERLFWTEQHSGYFQEWLIEKKLALLTSEDSKHMERLFCIEAFSEYLHRIVAALPSDLAVFCLFEKIQEKSWAKIAQLFSKERFEYIHLAFQEIPFAFPALAWKGGVSTMGSIGSIEKADSPSLALVIPLDGYCSPDVLERLDKIIEQLLEKSVPFRVIPEFFLAEGWDLVSTLIVISSAISPTGRRKIMGFMAAGGELLVDGGPVDFVEEEIQHSFFQKFL